MKTDLLRPPRGWVLPLGLAATDACWLYAWSLLVGAYVRPGRGAPLLGLVSIFVLLALGRAGARWAFHRGWPLARARVAVVACGLLVVTLAVRLDQYAEYGALDFAWLLAFWRDVVFAFPPPSPPLLAALLGLALWWRGTSQAASAVGSDDLEGAFRLGLAGLVGSALVAVAFQLRDLGLAPEQLGASVLGFFAAALVSLSLARLEAVREQARARGGAGVGMNRHWLAVLLAVVGGVVLVTALLAGAFSFDLLATLAAPLVIFLEIVLYLVLFLGALLLSPLLLLLEAFFRVFGHPVQFRPESQTDDSLLEQLQREGARGILPPEALLVLKVALLLVIVGLTLWLLARGVSRRREAVAAEGVEEEHDSLWTWQTLRVAVMAWLRSLVGRFRPAARATAPLAAGVLALGQADSPLALDVRAAYRRLLALGAAAGLPRAPAVTPLEHLPHLQARLTPPEDVAAITATYVKVRYGDEAPDEDQVEAVRARVRRVAPQSRPSGPAGTR